MRIDDDIPWLRDVSPADMRRIVDALYRVHYLLSAVTDLDSLLERIMEESKEVARAEACSLMLYDRVNQELYFQVAQGKTGDQQALKTQVRLKVGQGIAGVAAATRSSINVRDVANDTRFYSDADEVSHFKTRNLLAVPLVDRDDLIGVLEVVNKIGADAFSDTDLHVMEMFSSLAATAIANARLIEENLASARMAAIGQAVAGLSHYTKNIITGMIGSAELIDQGLALNDIAMLQRCWPVFKRSTNRIYEIVQDMLAFSKTRRPSYEACDIAHLISDATQNFTGLLARKEVTVAIHADLKQPVYLDSTGMFRCLLNLLTNAGDAVPSGGGKIDVWARLNAEGDLVLEVADNGPGVPQSDKLRIFEPFYSTKGSQGTGLGLAVTHKIVEEHSGSISVERGPEGGALFRILIPQQQPRLSQGE
ncbi:MAG: GAF domain-containing sensor histidine kinase [Candidatus Hydrogenedentes bacterium]|nr:GAF domain-containing sensor histidine kinase [Candidatus Hydrogenedentota bacterium]